jgi:hypothetical protein
MSLIIKLKKNQRISRPHFTTRGVLILYIICFAFGYVHSHFSHVSRTIVITAISP